MWKPHAPPPSRKTKSPDPERKQKTARRIAQIVKLKPEFIDKYKEVHAAVWPEVLQQIKVCNIQDCRLSRFSFYPVIKLIFPRETDPFFLVSQIAYTTIQAPASYLQLSSMWGMTMPAIWSVCAKTPR